MPADDIPVVTDGTSAPVVFAEVIRGVLIGNEVAKLRLVDHRLDALTNEVVALNVATIILPASQMRKWGEYLIKYAPEDAEGMPDA